MKLSQKLGSEIFQQIIENAEEGFMLLDVQAHAVLEHNARLLSLWNTGSEITDLKQLMASIHDEDEPHFLEYLLAPSYDKGVASIEFRIEDQAAYKWVNCKMYHVKARDKDLVACILNDINVEKENKKHLLDVNERKDTALHILVHDLRNPIAAIMAANALLERSYQKQQFDDIKTFVDIIRQYCDKSNELIKNILDYEYIQSKNVEVNRERFELTSRIHLKFDTYKMGSKELKKKFVLEANYPVYVEADQVKLLLVFENLLSNAYKFTADDGTITVSLEVLEDGLLAKVSDDGIGIPAEHLPIIFDQFTKARREGIQGEQPIGLGLHLAKKLIEMHQGTISVESTIGKGTTFTIWLPHV